MKYLYAFAVLLAMSCAASAQTVQPQCGKLLEMIDSLKLRYGETILLGGAVDTSTPPLAMVMTRNPTTGTWTLLFVQEDLTACIASTGGLLNMKGDL